MPVAQHAKFDETKPEDAVWFSEKEAEEKGLLLNETNADKEGEANER